MKEEPKSKPLNNYAKYSGLAFQMLVTIGLGTWGGIKIDEWLGNKVPICTVVLSLSSILGSLFMFIRGLPKE